MSTFIRAIVVVCGVAALSSVFTEAPDGSPSRSDGESAGGSQLTAFGKQEDTTPSNRDSAAAVAEVQALEEGSGSSKPQRGVSDAGAVATVAYVTGSLVNVRTSPSLKGRSLGQLAQGSKVDVLAAADGWSRVETSLGVGWMASRFLAPNAPDVVQGGASKPRAVAAPSSKEIQDAKNEIIRQSISAYPGSCPCPYNSDRAGRRCGGRSAWSKPGGYNPICYDSDISQERLKTFFARKRGAAN